MSSDIVLRGYRTTDLDAMFRLDETCFAEEFRFDRESMREFAEERNAIVRIAESCGEIVGFVIVHVERAASERQAYVVTLDVAAEYRREGLAGPLMQEAEASALAAGARWMQLHVFTGNAAAISFYEWMGYERIGLSRRFYGKGGLDAFRYRKKLSAS